MYIYDVAGFPKIRAQQLIDNINQQLKLFNPTVDLEQEIEKVQRLEDNTFKLTSNTKDVHYTRTIIITAGNGAFKPRKLNIENAEKFEEVNLHYFVQDMQQFKDEHVLILGGGDSAVDWALMLEPIAEKVTLVHRRDAFRAHEDSVDQLYKSSVEVIKPYVDVYITVDGRIVELGV